MPKPYVVAEGVDRGALEAEAEKLHRQGYVPTGGVSNRDRDGRLYQAFVLRHYVDETQLREPALETRKGKR